MLPPIDVPHLGDAQTCRIAHVIQSLLRDLRAKLSFAFKTSGSGAGPYVREERASISRLRIEELRRNGPAGAHPECRVSHGATGNRLSGVEKVERICLRVAERTKSFEKFIR